MKASELVKKLQELMAMHGDCNVWIGHWDMDFDADDSYPVGGVAFADESDEDNEYGESVILVQ